MILQRLKHDTRAHHERVERLVDLPSRLSSPAAYRAILARLYGFHEPVEAALARVEGLPQALPDVPARWKAARIAADLAALGLPAEALAALPRCADLPPTSDVAHALGCLYVLEGATLGGQIIARQLAHGPGVTAARGGAFFAGYGPETGAMWRGFGASLTRFAATPEREGAVLAAAAATFDALTRWLTEAD